MDGCVEVVVDVVELVVVEELDVEVVVVLVVDEAGTVVVVDDVPMDVVVLVVDESGIVVVEDDVPMDVVVLGVDVVVLVVDEAGIVVMGGVVLVVDIVVLDPGPTGESQPARLAAQANATAWTTSLRGSTGAFRTGRPRTASRCSGASTGRRRR
jgi:hypothetical protein